MRVNRRLRTLLQTGVYLCVTSVVLLEVLLRICAQYPGNSAIFVSDAKVGFRARPHVKIRSNRTNSSGFNDIERSKVKKHEFVRVAFIGDSFVFGAVPRKNNFVSVFEALAERSGERFEALNMGIPAAGPENYLDVLRNDAVEMQADVVCVVFFVGNDIFQSHPDFRTRVWLGAPRALLRSPFLLRPSGDYFYTYKLLRGGLRVTRNRWAKMRSSQRGTFSNDTFLEVEHKRLQICLLDPSSDLVSGYRGSVELLDQMRRESVRYGKEFFVVLAPDQFQVDTRLRSILLSRYKESSALYDFERPQAILGAALDSHSIAVLDPLPDFQRQEAEAPLYLPNDSHWNERGNRLAAESILRFMVSRNISTADTPD
ncbi:MAG: hypothetical protein GY856_34890 [bacterium]|nr:hypothetical protein [bacterium]